LRCETKPVIVAVSAAPPGFWLNTSTTVSFAWLFKRLDTVCPGRNALIRTSSSPSVSDTGGALPTMALKTFEGNRKFSSGEPGSKDCAPVLTCLPRDPITFPSVQLPVKPHHACAIGEEY